MSDEGILRATATVVAREGALHFTLADVGEEAGISAPGLVQRFGGKRQLLLALSERGRRAPGEAFTNARAAESSHLAALARALADIAAPLATPKDIARSLEYLTLDIAEPDFHAHARGFFIALGAEIESLLRDAVEARELRPCDVEALARAVEIAFNGSIITWALNPEGTLRDALMTDAAAVVEPYRTPFVGTL